MAVGIESHTPSGITQLGQDAPMFVNNSVGMGGTTSISCNPQTDALAISGTPGSYISIKGYYEGAGYATVVAHHVSGSLTLHAMSPFPTPQLNGVGFETYDAQGRCTFSSSQSLATVLTPITLYPGYSFSATPPNGKRIAVSLFNTVSYHSITYGGGQVRIRTNLLGVLFGSNSITFRHYIWIHTIGSGRGSSSSKVMSPQIGALFAL